MSNNTTHRNKRRMATRLTAGLIIAATITLGGCREKGPAEKVGEAIDDAKDKVSDTLDPKGPVEKAGRAIDRAVD